MRHFVLIAALVLSFMVSSQAVSAGGGQGKVELCHATHSETNPYVHVEVSVNAVFGNGQNAHMEHQDNEDIIPPFFYGGEWYSMNWTPENEAIFNNRCDVPVTPTPTEVPVTPTPTEVPVTPEPTEIPSTPVPTTPPTEVPATPEPTLPPTEVPTEPVTPEPTVPSTPVPTEPVTPEPTVEPTPEVTPTPPITDLPDTGTGTTESTVSLTLLMGVAALLTAGMSLGLRRR